MTEPKPNDNIIRFYYPIFSDKELAEFKAFCNTLTKEKFDYLVKIANIEVYRS